MCPFPQPEAPHFLNILQQEQNLDVQVGYDTIKKLQRHSWPGNVRELKNFVDRAALLAQDNRIETKYLADPNVARASFDQEEGIPVESEIDINLPFKDAKARLVDHFERSYWKKLLNQHRGNVSAAARQAGIHRKSAEYLIRKLEL